MPVVESSAVTDRQAGRLKATIGPVQAVSLYVGAVLGSGVLLMPGLAAEIAGPASLLAWIFMSLIVIPLALTMGLLSTRYPDAGGVSTFVRHAFGPDAGAIVGWLFLISVPVGVPVVAVTAAAYAGTAFGLNSAGEIGISAAVLGVVFTSNFLGMRLASRVQVLVVSAIVGVIIFVVAGALPGTTAASFTPFAPHGGYAVGQAAAMLFWCFIGWEAVTHLAEEFVDPRRDLMRSIVLSIVVVSLLYFAVALATVGTSSYGGSGSYASLALMMQKQVGPVAGATVGVTAFLICVAVANAYVGAAARVAYSLAREGAAPAFLGYLSPSRSTPVGGLGFIAVIATLTLVLVTLEMVTLTELITISNAAFMAIYIGGSLAGIRLLRDIRWGVLLAWISLVATLIVYVFLGWPAVIPLVVILVWKIVSWFRPGT
ncbi:MAG: amino acid permease [Desulfotomaculum sp. BICA1-6]|nr:MAG: amino acid permease [Desulfotomaculum sp. BICA1-6]